MPEDMNNTGIAVLDLMYDLKNTVHIYSHTFLLDSLKFIGSYGCFSTPNPPAMFHHLLGESPRNHSIKVFKQQYKRRT